MKLYREIDIKDWLEYGTHQQASKWKLDLLNDRQLDGLAVLLDDMYSNSEYVSEYALDDFIAYQENIWVDWLGYSSIEELM